ncbi:MULTISPECIES: thiamine pyrophosphate-binding protein [unclassified Pseudofrankia]|uniref:thiamine pyrophosphate-binding protein n=1 Tax=unclassified Pseudofrankia TaxID=2994372 RepID=UPI0008D9548F|nr:MULTISPECIES: thiamine pyrophosphate-binding protein [unclassified Pseudofrankia]MDT3441504.1 thiamine pyrophosphate-binding protein [Pseudofrankia sp. BMG5.37]OHV48930.1 thiamine pyrophosphate-binding protein [Pseudofrankia sp. BMG5.36]
MTVGDWLRRQGLRHVVEMPGGPRGGGAGRVVPGIRAVPAPDLDCALALAEAEGTMGAGLGALWDGDVLTLFSRRVDPGEPATARSAPELAAAVSRARKAGAGAVAVHLDFDLTADPEPPVAGTPATALMDRGLAPRLPGAACRPGAAGPLEVDLVLAGHGVVRAGAARALAELAARGGLGVLNVFTAKGVFRWDSPHHLGTGFLQERDLALAGAYPDAVVVTVGLDADECAPALFAAAGVDPARLVIVDPADLPAAAATMRARVPVTEGGPRPALYRELAAVAGPLYAATGAPLNPACAAADLAAVLPEGGSVWTEPGPAAHWIGRTFSTVRLGSVRVPAAGRDGVAIAGALSAALAGDGIGVAVVDHPPHAGVAAACLDWAGRLGIRLVVEVWGERGVPRSSAQHREWLVDALATPGVRVLELPVDYTATQELVAAAGPLVAWTVSPSAGPM